MERAFEATPFGAAGMIAKPAEIISPKFWDILTQTFFNLPDYLQLLIQFFSEL
jgi:hypothetical protein